LELEYEQMAARPDAEILFCKRLNDIRNKYSIMAAKYASKMPGGFNDMIESGSKGNILNLTQVVALLGQQSVSGGRIPLPPHRLRTTVHFPRNDNGAMARGFVANSYFNGLTPPEMFFHSMGGREGLIDTAIKTATIGYIQRRFVKFMEEATIWYDGTIRLGIHHKKQMIQLAYGFNNYSPIKVNLVNLHMADSPIPAPDCVHQIPVRWSKHAPEAELVELRQVWEEVPYIPAGTSMQVPFNVDMLLFEAKAKVGAKSTTIAPAAEYSTRLVKFISHLPDLVFPSVKPVGANGIAILRRLTFETRAVLLDRLCTTRMVEEHKLSMYQFEKILSQIRNSIIESISSPGEMVGTVAGHSLGEPAMQLTLNTFHSSGTGSSGVITNGISQLNRLISLHDKPEVCNMRIYHKVAGASREQLEILSSKLVACTLKSLLISIRLYHITDVSKSNVVWKDQMDFLRKIKVIASGDGYSPHVIEMVLKPSELYKHRLTPMDVEDRLRRVGDMTTFSVFTADLMCIVLIPHSSVFKSVEQVEKTIPHFLKTPVAGVRNISEAYVIEAKEPGEYCIQTVGSNLLDVMLLPDVDANRIWTNSPHEMFSMFGHQATMQMLFNEVKDVYPMYIDPRHIHLMVNCMFFKRIPLSITRYGHRAMPIGPINHSIFETPFESWIQATMTKTVDSAVSLEGSTVFGQIGRFGSMMSQVVPLWSSGGLHPPNVDKLDK
jgi:DNA-directed RNA polymerase II subunit RPB1